MAFITAEEQLAKWNASPKYREHKREIDELRKDISTARALIYESIGRYKKKKLRARSVKAAVEDPFRDLSDYRSKQDIQDAYGFDCISESEMHRLWNLWDLRDEGCCKEGEYTDRVIKMLEAAINGVEEPYADTLYDFEQGERERRREAEQYAIEHNRADYAFHHPESKEV